MIFAGRPLPTAMTATSPDCVLEAPKKVYGPLLTT